MEKLPSKDTKTKLYSSKDYANSHTALVKMSRNFYPGEALRDYPDSDCEEDYLPQLVDFDWPAEIEMTF